MRKFLAGLIVGVVITLTTSGWAVENVRLVVNGTEVQSDVPPQIIGGRTLVPARPLAEALGAVVEWDGTTRTVAVATKEAPAVSDHVNLRTLAERYGLTLTVPEVKDDGPRRMRVEGNGHYVDLPMEGGPIVSGVSDSSATVNATLQNQRLSVSEGDLRAAGITP